MNKQSSRSHLIFCLTVSQNKSDNSNNITAKLFLVDLAGSEKISKTGYMTLFNIKAQLARLWMKQK